MSEQLLQRSAAQTQAIKNVRIKAKVRQAEAKQSIIDSLQSEGIEASGEDLIYKIKQTAVVTVNFHPDRLSNDGRAVVTALFEDGIYKSQFETGISNGGLNHTINGKRTVWERNLWGDIYSADGVLTSERPKYGGLNLMDYPDGACPRFGSCHFKLRQSVLEYTSFTFGDSSRNDKEYDQQSIGTIDVFEPVLVEFLTEAKKRDIMI